MVTALTCTQTNKPPRDDATVVCLQYIEVLYCRLDLNGPRHGLLNAKWCPKGARFGRYALSYLANIFSHRGSDLYDVVSAADSVIICGSTPSYGCYDHDNMIVQYPPEEFATDYCLQICMLLNVRKAAVTWLVSLSDITSTESVLSAAFW